LNTATSLSISASRQARGYTIALTGTVIWSTTAIFIRYLTVQQAFPPLLLAAWRDLLACLTIMLGIAIFSRKLLRLQAGQTRFIILYGGILASFNALWTTSVALNGAAVSTVLVYSSAAFTALIAWRFFKEILNLTKTIAILLAIGGCVLVAGAYNPSAWQSNTLGVITGLLSGLAMTAYSLAGKESARRGISSWTAVGYSFGVAAIFLFAANVIFPTGTTRSLLPDLDTPGWVAFVLLAMGPTVGGYGLYTLSMSYLPASIVNLIATLEPSMTAGLAYIFLSERLTLEQIIGSLLILGGVVFLRLRERNNRPQAQPHGVAD
jgi:drug/metabolite transporter, DME family